MNTSRLLPAVAAGLLLIAGIASSSAEDPRPPTVRPEDDVAARSRVQKLSDVIGFQVENLSGVDLGTIDDVVITQADGRVAYALISFGGVLGIGDKLVTVSWNRLKQSALKKKTFILDADEEELKKAPAVDKDRLPLTILSRSSLQAVPPAESVGARSGSEEERSDGRKTEPSARGSLPFKVKKGHRFAFEAGHPTSAAGKAGADGEAPSASGHVRRSYSMIVQDVSERGDITLHLALDGARAPKAAASTRESDESTSPAPALNVMTLTLGPNGRLTGARAAESRLPPNLESHFQFIFGSGLHIQELQRGRTYTLAPLYASAGGASVETRLRYEDTTLHGDTEMARFSILSRAEGTADRSPSLDTTRPEGGPPPGRETSEGSRSAPPDGTAWKAIGEAVYRSDDGFLEKVTLGSVESIVRVRTIP